jgi:hypothetical protein
MEVVYSKTKRDIRMHQRRKENLRMPNSPITQIVLEKYEVNEKRIVEVAALLSDPDCII